MGDERTLVEEPLHHLVLQRDPDDAPRCDVEGFHEGLARRRLQLRQADMHRVVGTKAEGADRHARHFLTAAARGGPASLMSKASLMGFDKFTHGSAVPFF